jgi:hypothetical protein
VDRWGTKRIAGVTYDLNHLNPFFMDIAPKFPGAPTYRVRVSFGCHTFTREFKPADTPDVRFTHKGETRCFCTHRHNCSLQLPPILQGQISRVYFTQRGTYFIAPRLPRLASPYFITFDVERSKSPGHVVSMFVASAYEKTDMPTEVSAITMATLISKTAVGGRITPPRPIRVRW